MDNKTLEITGNACLCFAEDHSSFQGYMIITDKKQYSLTGAVDTSHVIPNACCYDDKPICYTVDAINCETKEQQQFSRIIRQGGDNCSLISDNLNFHTEQLLIGFKAEECIKKFFTNRSTTDNECYVCLGELTLTEDDHR